jgi:transcriptional regulator with XRE-family HTH domain
MPQKRTAAAARRATSDEQAPEPVGRRIRAERERQGISVRELSRRVDVSASMISQVELGRATPSVGTLYAIVSELGLSLDELFNPEHAVAAPERGNGWARARRNEVRRDDDVSHPPHAAEDVVLHDERKSITLGSGVRWERLTSETERDVDFLYVVYDVGGASCAPDSLMRHAGREYGHVIKGRLGVTVGFDTHILGPGDSIAFDSTQPHRLFNDGDEPAEGIWFVLGRSGDARVKSLHDAS